ASEKQHKTSPAKNPDSTSRREKLTLPCRTPGRGGLFLLEASANGFDGPWLLGELARLELGIDQVAVDAQLETATARRNELQLTDLLFVGGQELARQTDGLGLVISHRTVFEFYLHSRSRRLCCSQTRPATKVQAGH